MAVTVGAIERSVIREIPDPPAAPTLDELGEITQQFQIAISGTAAAEISWDETDLTFDVEFINGEFQRYSNLTRPQITKGSLVDGGEPVVVDVCVRSWETDDRGVIVGATVAIGVCSPGSEVGVAFTGSADIAFEGYGSVPNEPAEPDFTD